MSKTLEDEVKTKPDFSEYSIWPTIRNRRDAIEWIEKNLGVDISYNAITEAIWPRDKTQVGKLKGAKIGQGKSRRFSERELVEWVYSIVEGN